MPYRITRKPKLEQQDIVAITAPLQQFNLDHGPAPEFLAVVLTIEDDEGNIHGGLFGRCAYRWMHVEYLVVPSDARHQHLGTQLMQQAETIAREHGCIGAYLDTLHFQALTFYRKLGYTIFGELEERGGGPHTFLKKRLDR